MFPSLAKREALFPVSILFPRSKICFCYTAETFRVSARHGSMEKRGNNYKNMFLETSFLVFPGLKMMFSNKKKCAFPKSYVHVLTLRYLIVKLTCRRPRDDVCASMRFHSKLQSSAGYNMAKRIFCFILLSLVHFHSSSAASNKKK